MLIPDDDLPLIVRALEHYADYMRATQRDERPFLDIVARLQRKQPAKEHATEKVTRKRG